MIQDMVKQIYIELLTKQKYLGKSMNKQVIILKIYTNIYILTESRKRYEGFASRIAVWWLRCLIEAKLKVRRINGHMPPKLILKEFLERWKHTLSHFTNECN